LSEIVSTLGPQTIANVHLEVTVTDPASVPFVTQLLRDKKVTSANVSLVPNIGRDLGPLFTACKSLFHDYKYVAHLHTKRSLQTSYGDDWRRYLVGNLVGSDENLQKQICYLERHPTCGIIYPENFAPTRRAVLSQTNRSRTEQLLTVLNPNWGYELRDFPAGSMCWLRAEAFANVLPRLPPIEDYEMESGQFDGTLAHALERCLTLIPHNLGYSAIAYRSQC
jgi:lipopolysaccharide biosynthesis protein